MAILKSIITEGASGSMGNVTLRQVCGQTVASQKRIGRAYSKLSTQQKEQCSAFKWAVKSLQYAPLYPQIAFARLETKSGYNRCVGLLVDAVKENGMPGSANFLTLVDVLDGAHAQVSLGLPTRGYIGFEGDDTDLEIQYEGFVQGDRCHLWYVVGDETRAQYMDQSIGASGDCYINLTGVLKAIAVVTHDGVPYTFDSSALYL